MDSVGAGDARARLPRRGGTERQSVIAGLRKEIRRVAPTDATVLIEGEADTGKEPVAQVSAR